MNDRRRMGHLAMAVIVLGLLIGIAAGGLSLLLLGIERVAMGFIENSSIPGPFHVSASRRVISVVVGAAIAALIWWVLRTRTTRVPSVGRAVAGDEMPWWQTTVHVLLQIVIVGSGSSIGREVAPREFAAMLAQRYLRLARWASTRFERWTYAWSDADRRMLVAVSAGAGLAGVYDAPLAGAFFSVEILLAEVTLEKVAVSLGMSALAAAVATAIKDAVEHGHHVFYVLPGLPSSGSPSLMVFAVLAGAICGIDGALFRAGSRWGEAGPRRDAGLLWRMPAAAAFTGLVAVVLPQVFGNGRAAAQLAFDPTMIGRLVPGFSNLVAVVGSRTVAVALILVVTVVAKAGVTILTIRSGASGGVLQPGIAVGANLGALLGMGWTLLVPGASPAAYALIGACALLAASQHAPLMALCLVMELCAAPLAFMVPAGIAVAFSCLVSTQLSRRPGTSRSRSQRN